MLGKLASQQADRFIQQEIGQLSKITKTTFHTVPRIIKLLSQLRVKKELRQIRAQLGKIWNRLNTPSFPQSKQITGPNTWAYFIKLSFSCCLYCNNHVVLLLSGAHGLCHLVLLLFTSLSSQLTLSYSFPIREGVVDVCVEYYVYSVGCVSWPVGVQQKNPFSVFLQSREEASPLTVFNMFPVNGGNACLKFCC